MEAEREELRALATGGIMSRTRSTFKINNKSAKVALRLATLENDYRKKLCYILTAIIAQNVQLYTGGLSGSVPEQGILMGSAEHLFQIISLLEENKLERIIANVKKNEKKNETDEDAGMGNFTLERIRTLGGYWRDKNWEMLFTELVPKAPDSDTRASFELMKQYPDRITKGLLGWRRSINGLLVGEFEIHHSDGELVLLKPVRVSTPVPNIASSEE